MIQRCERYTRASVRDPRGHGGESFLRWWLQVRDAGAGGSLSSGVRPALQSAEALA
jgi:hypothetical protein